MRSKRPASVAGISDLTTVIFPVRRVLVIVQVTVSFESTVTSALVPSALTSLSQSIDESYLARSVPSPSSETL